MELLVHINKRVKSRSKVPLPVSDLLRQYSDPNVEPFVTVREHTGRVIYLLSIV